MAVKRSSAHAMTKRRDTQEEASLKHAIEIEKKCYKYGAIVLAVIAVIVVLNIFDFLPHFNGSMRYYNGVAYGASDGDIIACADSSANRYFNIGSLTVPEGYTNDSSLSSRTDTNIKDYYLKNDADEKLKYIYVTGVGKSWDEMYSSVYSYNTLTDEDGNVYATPTEYSGTTESGLKYHVMVSPAQADSYNDNYNKYATCYVEASHNCCVLVMPYLTGATETDFPADDVFMDYINVVLNNLKIK